ncbi:ABC transporter substrate-binding protein [Deinococcus hopiensis]|uniref:Amino acid ABC transporter substrate-binding protein, PAAT family n=1 Tax=Deinococcus hopiensis KR-140 TaxID=695939 RepID=A0A1W1VI64_9DEIO|nr:ABC transporter substrate-binding protein [Deinococcus hopiensis]SMB93057.1 amino acid ABC transporter substrate-binding protein, PAAT family [Deinococcus hopiensis KR-140]
MRRVIILSLALTATASAASVRDQICQDGKFTAGVKYDSPPFGFVNEDGDVGGFDVDLVREIAKDLTAACKKPIKLELKQVTSKNRIEFVQNGTIDLAAATATATYGRMDVVDFSNTYFIDGQRLLVPADSAIKTVKDLAGKRVGTAQGSTSEVNLKAAAPKTTVVSFQQYTDAFTALQQGRVDAVSTDSTILLGLKAGAPDPSKFKLVGAYFSNEPYGMILKQNDSKWRNFVNESLTRMATDGTYAKIFRKWFGPKTKYSLPDPKRTTTVPEQFPVRR